MISLAECMDNTSCAEDGGVDVDVDVDVGAAKVSRRRASFDRRNCSRNLFRRPAGSTGVPSLGDRLLIRTKHRPPSPACDEIRWRPRMISSIYYPNVVRGLPPWHDYVHLCPFLYVRRPFPSQGACAGRSEVPRAWAGRRLCGEETVPGNSRLPRARGPAERESGSSARCASPAWDSTHQSRTADAPPSFSTNVRGSVHHVATSCRRPQPCWSFRRRGT